MDAWQLREWFDEFLEALNRHDLERIRGFLHPQVRRAHLPGGADAWVEELGARFAAFPDWQWKRITVVVEDDRIAAHLRARGTHRGPFGGIAATGRHVNLAEFGMLRVVAGRIVEYAGTGDDAQLRRLLVD